MFDLLKQIGKPDIGPRYLRQILVARARVQGFLVFDFIDRYSEARSHILNLINDQKSYLSDKKTKRNYCPKKSVAV